MGARISNSSSDKPVGGGAISNQQFFLRRARWGHGSDIIDQLSAISSQRLSLPRTSMASLTPATRWEESLSRMTMSPCLSSGASTCCAYSMKEFPSTGLSQAHWCVDAIVAKGGNKGGTLPMTMREGSPAALSTGRTPSRWHHALTNEIDYTLHVSSVIPCRSPESVLT